MPGSSMIILCSQSNDFLKPIKPTSEKYGLFSQGYFDHLIPVTHQFFFGSKKRMVDGNSGDLPDFSKCQFEAVCAIFSDLRPQSIVFAHGVTFLGADSV